MPFFTSEVYDGMFSQKALVLPLPDNVGQTKFDSNKHKIFTMVQFMSQ
jgi:hypothetical protein